MKHLWNYFFVLIWIAYLISSGIYLFSKGFLLSRVSQTDTSECRKLSENPKDDYFLSQDLVNEIFKDINATSSLCLPKKSKVVILVVDALKYEFGVFKVGNQNPLPYENKLTIFHELLTQQPNNSRLLKFRADPPTTTLQRLKGLTTGSLPTFIDIGSNFATPEINEDNIIDQIVKNGLPTVFLGDSTWTDLYPKRFKRAHSYPSFDIFDLDSVDNEILKHLPNELLNEDWEVLIAHFLGVDHCGHKHGPLHAEMTRKLTEMDNVIRDVIQNMDEDAVLIVMGDHGMTISGDHGGESEDELNALFFAYSKGHKFVPQEFESDNVTMQQIDLVPTLATILGVPIPYSNLGLINLHILPDVPVRHMSRYQVLLLHAWQNAKQIYNYFYNYAMDNKRTFSYEEMDDLENTFLVLTHRVNTIYTEGAFKSFIKDLNLHVRSILDICRQMWVKFDPSLMSQGLLMTFLPIFFTFLLINNSKVTQLPKIFTTKVVSFIYFSSFIFSILAYHYHKDLSMKSEEHSVIFATNMLGVLTLVFLTLQNWSDIAINWSKVKRFNNLPTRLIYVISIIVFFSNSFIIEEQKILSYLLIGLILVLLYQVIQETYTFDSKTKFKLSLILKSITLKLVGISLLAIIALRFSYLLFRCREEQGNCTNFSNMFSTQRKGSDSKYYLATVVVLVFYTTLTRIYLRSCGNLTGFSVNVIMARYGPTVAAICAGGHILLTNSTLKNIKLSHIDAMALVIYVLFLAQLLIVFICPLMTYVLPKLNNTITVNPYGNVIPEIFKKIKKVYEGDDTDRRGDIPVVYGLATIYSSVLISLGVFLALVLVILLDARSAMGIFICILVASALLTLHSILRYKTAENLESCLQPTFTAIVGWLLIAQFCFYATSHQPTMSQIDWRAAFVGRSANFDHSNFISGILVIFNTFSGQILFLSLYGLLCSETFSIFALFPSLTRIKMTPVTKKVNTGEFRSTTINRDELSTLLQSIDFDITRGELILFENERHFFGSLFKTACQFFMLQGLKVFCAMMACTIHCRHLMVWKIFAPRFIYEGLNSYVSFPALIFGYLVYSRVHWSVSRLINRINKTK